MSQKLLDVKQLSVAFPQSSDKARRVHRGPQAHKTHGNPWRFAPKDDRGFPQKDRPLSPGQQPLSPTSTTPDLPNSLGFAVNNVSFSVSAGKTLCLVGESGCGKSLTALSVMKLLPETARLVSGQCLFEGRDLFQMTPESLSSVRGNDIGMIFQDPMSSLNPVMRVGTQVAEPLRRHLGCDKKAALQKVEELFTRVGIHPASERIHEYPHQLSGGLRQRVVIAQALACQPKLIIADEPTTALDVTVQKQILGLLHSLVYEMGSGMLLISHDLSVVSACADDVAVMYAGSIVEQGSVSAILENPLHPYTQGLLASRISLLNDGAGLNPEDKSDFTCGDKGGGSDGHCRQLETIPGTVPSLWERPAGCVFHPRCPKAAERCRLEDPALDYERAHKGEHVSSCFFALG